MKMFTEDQNNLVILNETEMSKILGGNDYTTASTIEDDDDWM